MNVYQEWFQRMKSHEPIFNDGIMTVSFEDCAFRIIGEIPWVYTDETWACFGYKKAPFDLNESKSIFKKKRMKYIVLNIAIFCAIAGASIYAIPELKGFSRKAYMAYMVTQFEAYRHEEKLANNYHLDSEEKAFSYFEKKILQYATALKDEDILITFKKHLEEEGLSGKQYSEGILEFYTKQIKPTIEFFGKVKITDVLDYPPHVKPNTLL